MKINELSDLRRMSIIQDKDRLKILKAIGEGKTFSELLSLFKMKDYEMSFHLAMMVDYGILGSGFFVAEGGKRILKKLEKL